MSEMRLKMVRCLAKMENELMAVITLHNTMMVSVFVEFALVFLSS